MAISRKIAWLMRWLGRVGLAVFVLMLLAEAVFWRWPLHVQAYLPPLGERLNERPTAEEWDAAKFGSAESQPTPLTQDYFPERTFALTVAGESFMEISLAEEMRKLGEASLYVRRTEPATHLYRFTWSRSFEPQIVVRLEMNTDGSAQLISKHFALRPVGKGLVTHRTQKLSRRQASRLVEEFEQRGFWKAPADDDVYGIDGSTWVFEGCRDGRYHVVKVYTPENGNPLKSLGLDLLEEAGFWRGPVY
jgi:hypothetical protein